MAGDELLSETIVFLDDILKGVSGEMWFDLVKNGVGVGRVKFGFRYQHVSGKLVF